ncbi:MAG: SDR family NAD(P)-dependent oxidoreductase [Candidatus Woesearchaeota archaeon]
MNALITGASSGLGKDFAHIAAKRGYNLILVARRKELLLEIKKDIEQQYEVSVAIVVADLTKPGVIETLVKKHNDIKMLINNAGFGLTGPFEELSSEKQANMIHLNCTILMELSHAYIPILIKNKGYILNVASIAGFIPGPYMATYFATKAYVVSLSNSLHKEYKGKIGITCLCPGPTETEFQKVAGATFKGVPSYPVAKKGFDAMLKKKRMCIPGLGNKMSVLASTILPTGIALDIISNMNKPKILKEKQKR